MIAIEAIFITLFKFAEYTLAFTLSQAAADAILSILFFLFLILFLGGRLALLGVDENFVVLFLGHKLVNLGQLLIDESNAVRTYGRHIQV